MNKLNQSMEYLTNHVLSITSDYTFCKVMEDNPELCRELVQIILGDEIGELELIEKQKQINTTVDGRGVRLDVYCRDKNAVYNIEMQVAAQPDIGKRARFYQSTIDSDLLDKNQAYRALLPSYVIFISPKDLLGAGEEICLFEMLCKDHLEVRLQTDAKIIVVSATEKGLLRQDALGCFLRYMAGHEPADVFTEKVEEAVKRASMDAEWRKAVYTWEMKLKDTAYYAKEEGVMEGLKQGLEKGIEQGLEQGRNTLLKKQIKTRMERGMSLAEIAEDLEISIEETRKILGMLNQPVE